MILSQFLAWVEGLWGPAPRPGSITFGVCVCVRVRVCMCVPRSPGWKLRLKSWCHPLFGMCVALATRLWWLLGPHLLCTPPFLPTEDLGLPARSLYSRTVLFLSPCPLAPAPSLALGCPRAGHPGLAQEAGLETAPLPCTPVCVASCALGKVERSINFWCSGLLLWGFPLGQGWGHDRHSRCPCVLVIEGCRPQGMKLDSE